MLVQLLLYLEVMKMEKSGIVQDYKYNLKKQLFFQEESFLHVFLLVIIESDVQNGVLVL